MKNDERRFHRIDQLSKAWLRSKGDIDLIMHMARKMGVGKATAKDYVETVRRRYPL